MPLPLSISFVATYECTDDFARACADVDPVSFLYLCLFTRTSYVKINAWVDAFLDYVDSLCLGLLFFCPQDCLTRGCLSPDCPNSGWRASGEGGPRGDAEAAREIAAAAAQGNLLAAAAARKYFSPEDAAFLQDAALRTLQEHGGIHGGAPMAHHYLLEGPHSSPSSAEGAYKSSRDKEKRRKHREKSHSKVAQEHYRLPSEAAEGRGWGTPWGAPVGASGWMTPGGPPAAVKEGSSRHEKRCPREARKRGSSKETGGRSGTAQREFSRQSSSSGEEKWHRPNGHHGRQVGLPFQYHEPMIHKTHNNKK